MLGEKSERKPDPSTGKMTEDFWAPSLKLLGDLKFLDRLKTINHIKMPKIRRWYYNKDDKFLGTDILN